MRKTNIKWTRETWKIVEGCDRNCLNNEGKPYCYTHRFLKDPLNPRFYLERLEEPLHHKPSLIFVANTGDLMNHKITDAQIIKIFDVMHDCPQHIFQLLTKNPERYLQISPADWRPWIWIGTSVTRQEDIDRVETLRKVLTPGPRFISFEPLLGYISCHFGGMDWAILGAESVGRQDNPKDPLLSQIWAKPLVSQVRKAKIPLFIKENLKWSHKVEEMPRQFYEWRDKYIKDSEDLQGKMF